MSDLASININIQQKGKTTMTHIIIWSAIAVFAIVVAFMSYVKAPPDIAYIISGLKRRTVIGRAGFRIPFFERLDKVPLELIQVDVKTKQKVPNKDFINVNVDAVVNIKVGKTPAMIDLASIHFLNASPRYIAETAQEVLEGNMREIVGEMTTKEMVLNRQQFAEKVKANAQPDLERMGLEIISFNVQNFSDDDKAIENLGIDNISKITKDAKIARAQAESDVAVAEAQAKKIANDARVASETEIAMRNNELAIKKADLKQKEDIQIAIAEAAKGIQAEEQRKIKEIAAGEANIAMLEKQTEQQERAVQITEKQLDAEVRKKAEADKFAKQQQADASLYTEQRNAEADLVKRSKAAEAEKVEAERQAEAIKAIADANKVKGENEAAVIKARGEAEAEAIRQKALAEAEGLEKKADAMAKYGEAAKMDLQLQVAKAFVSVLPEVATGIAGAYAKVGNITMYGDQSSALIGNIIDKTTQISNGLSEGIGLDLKSILAGALGMKVLENKEKIK